MIELDELQLVIVADNETDTLSHWDHTGGLIDALADQASERPRTTRALGSPATKGALQLTQSDESD